MRRLTFRGLPALGILVTAIVLGGCGSTASSDPYELVLQSAKTTWSPIQVNIGVKATSNGATVTLDPASIAVVLDSAGGKGAFHLSLPAAALGIPAASLAQLGVSGSSIDVDLVDDGAALYARSPLFKPLLQLLLGSGGSLPSGDLIGWLKLGTNAELAAFGAMAQGSVGKALPSASAGAETTASMKSDLEAAGISLSLAGVEKHNGADAQHVKITVDATKLANNPNFAAGAGQNYAQVAEALKTLSISGDLWLDAGSKRIVETDLHFGQASGGSDSADLTITARDPDGSVSLAGPTTSVDVPLQTLAAQVLQLMSKGLGG